MQRLSGRMVTIGLRLMASVALFGCNDAGLSINPTAGSPDGIGLVDTVPQIGGEWLAAATVTSNTCGSLAAVPADEMLLRIDQVDTAITIDVITPCGGNTGASTGTLTPGNVLTATANRTTVVSQRCTLMTTTTLTATVNNTGSSIEGSVTVDVTPSAAPAAECGPGFPCGYDQMLTAAPCPPSGCLLGVCPVAAAP